MRHTDMIGESSNSLRRAIDRCEKVWPEFWDRFSNLQHAIKIEKEESCFKIIGKPEISYSIHVLFGGLCFVGRDNTTVYWFRGVEVILEIEDAT